MKKLDYINAIRGLAILGVILVHTNMYGRSDLPASIGNMVNEGARGVQLFYLASAFTLFLSFKNRSLVEKAPIRNFFIRRFFRIAPMYYLGIGYYLFQDGLGARYWLSNETHITTLNILSNFTFLHGLYPYWINSLVPGGWSIAVEMMFYAVLPFLFSKIKNVNQAFIAFIISLLLKTSFDNFLIKYPLIDEDRLWREFLYFYFPSQLPVFCLGILLYFFITENDVVNKISGKPLLFFSALVFAQLCFGVQYFLPHHVLFSIGFLFLALALSKFQFRIIVNPIVNYIGEISFSMYLVHFATLYWLAHFNLIDYFDNGILNYITRFSIVTILTILVSSILYNSIERPFQEIAKRMIGRLEKNTSPQPGFAKKETDVIYGADRVN